MCPRTEQIAAFAQPADYHLNSMKPTAGKGFAHFAPTMQPLCSHTIFPYIYSPNIPPNEEKRLLVLS